MIPFVFQKHWWLRQAATKTMVARAAAVVLIFASHMSVAQEQAPAPATSAEEQAVPASEPLVNRLTQAAVGLGALTCAARVQQVTSFLGVTSETLASIRRPATPPDRNSLSLAMTTQTDGTTAIALAEFYPAPGSCKASYNLTVNLPKPCSELRNAGFASFGEASTLAENITVLGDATSLRVVLMDAGEGCTVIKTETLE